MEEPTVIESRESRKELKSFLDTLRDIRNGAVITDLTLDLADLVGAVVATHTAGTLTLTLKVKPLGKGDENTLTILDEIKVKLPKPAKNPTVLYATDEHNLQRNDPRQPSLLGLRQPATVTSISRPEVQP
jgi:hypothetical protein